MIIRLSRADFSANNIGKYEFPKDLSQFTLDAIAASGKVMTDEQKYAMEYFFTSIGAINNNGIWAKLDKVYIPFIGADVTKGLVNYKDNNLDNTLNADNLTLVNGGVKVKGSSDLTPSDANKSSTLAVREIQKQVAKMYNIPVLDMWEEANFTLANAMYNYAGGSGVHPGINGYNRIGETVAKLINY